MGIDRQERIASSSTGDQGQERSDTRRLGLTRIGGARIGGKGWDLLAGDGCSSQRQESVGRACIRWDRQGGARQEWIGAAGIGRVPIGLQWQEWWRADPTSRATDNGVMVTRRARGEYPPDWHEIAARVKDEAGRKCVRCGHGHHVASGHVLTVHHLDGDKSNCRWWNLAALCQRCHLTIQGRVDMEREWMFEHSPWFKPYVAGFYAHRAGLPDDRDSVAKRMDEYLGLAVSRVVR